MVKSQDFGEDLLHKYGKLRFVSTPKNQPEYTIEMWTLEFLMDTMYVVTLNGAANTWSNKPSLFDDYLVDETFGVIIVSALK